MHFTIHSLLHLHLHPLLQLFALLFLLPDVCHACRVAPPTACQKPPFVPGHNLVGEGFDVVKLQTTGASVVDINSYQSGAYGNCTLCQNRLLGQEQKLPAAVLDWQVWPRCRRDLSARIYETSNAILEQNDKVFSSGAKVGLSLGGQGAVYLGGTHSKSSRFAISRSTKDRYSFTSHEVSCRYYS